MCDKCGSGRMASVNAKCSDLCNFQYGDIQKDGYVPDDVGIGGGDYVEFTYCLDCGKIQGKFPILEEGIRNTLADEEGEWEEEGEEDAGQVA